MTKFLYQLIAAVLVAILTSSCSSIKQTRGYVPDEELVAAIRVETDNKESISGMLGNPTMKATFDDNNWYYYSKRTERWAFFKEEVVEMDILAITFDSEDYVSGIKHYTVADNKIIDPISKKTLTHGKDVNFLAELFGNIGRFGSGGGGPQAGN